MPDHSSPVEVPVLHDPAASRFEINLEGHRAVLEYLLEGGRMLFTHTDVPPELEGRGLGSRLARAGLDHAREKGLKVVPLCSFIAAYLRKHPEYQDLLD